MTKEEMVAEFKSQLEEFKNTLPKSVTMEDLEALNVDELKSAMEAQGLVLAQLKEQGLRKDVTFKEVVNAAFEVEGIEDRLKQIVESGAGVLDVIKAVGTITTGAVTTDTGGNALLDLINADDIFSMRLRDPFIEDFCSVTRTNKPVYTYADYLPKEGDVDFVLEGGAKPQLDLKIEVRSATPKKAAGHQVLTDEAVQDIPRMQTEANTNVFKRYRLRRQSGILFGDGTGANPLGITNIAPAFNAATWTGDKKAAPNLYDAMVAVKNQIELAANFADDLDYSPNVMFINPAEYNALLINQDDKSYVFNNVNGMKVMNVDGVMVVPKKEIPTGKILAGDFTKLNIINYIDYNVKVGYINDQLINNLFTMVGEGRFYVVVRELDKLAFVYDDIATVITGITAS